MDIEKIILKWLKSPSDDLADTVEQLYGRGSKQLAHLIRKALLEELPKDITYGDKRANMCDDDPWDFMKGHNQALSEVRKIIEGVK